MRVVSDKLTPLERTELVLMDAAQIARRRGLQIISGQFSVSRSVCRRVVACCPITSVRLDGRWPPKQTAISNEQIGAFVLGFDGIDFEHDIEHLRPWYALGRRLRRRLRPVPASSVTG